MMKKAKRIIARIMTVLMIISVLPLDMWGTANVVQAAEPYVHNFSDDNSKDKFSSTNDGFFTITGNMDSNFDGTVSYNSMTLTKALKSESSTTITFNAASSGKLLIITAKTGSFKMDGGSAQSVVAVTGSNYYSTEFEVGAGSHTLTRGSSDSKILYISFTPEGSTVTEPDDQDPVGEPTADPDSGAVADGTPVELSAEEGTTIYYKLSNAEPTEYTEYNGAITIHPPVTITAYAKRGEDESEPITFEYILRDSSYLDPPTAKPGSSQLDGETEITLEPVGDAEGVDIYYTVDGSEPTDSETDACKKYSVPFNIIPPATVKAIAVKGEAKSGVAEFIYTAKPVDAPVPSLPTGTEVEKETIITLTANGAEKIRYTIDGTTDPTIEDEAVEVVDGSEAGITINEATTIKAVAVKNGVMGALLEASYTIKVAGKPVANKTGKVAAGTEIEISSATAGATIYYTMGSDPMNPTTESLLHGASPVTVTINADTTIKAIAVKDKYDDSGVATFNYTVIDTSKLVEHVLDADAIMNASTESKYEYEADTQIPGTDGYFIAMASKDKKASINKIADLRKNTGTTDAPKYEYYYANLSWNGVDISEREYAAVITGGGIALNAKDPKTIVNAIKFTTEAYAEGVVYYSLKEKPSKDRTLGIYSGIDTKLGSAAVSQKATNNTKVEKLEFRLPTPGTYYVGFSGSGGIIPYMVVTEDFSKDAEEGPESTKTKTITVSDSTETIVDAELNGDVSFINAADKDAEDPKPSDAVNILLKAEQLAADNAAITDEIKTMVAQKIKALNLESGGTPEAYYYDLTLEDKDKAGNGLLLTGGSVKFEVSYEKLGMSHNDSLVVLHGIETLGADKITKDKKSQSFWVEADSFSPYIFIVNKAANVDAGDIAISDSAGYEEGAYAEWDAFEADGVDGYVAYVSTAPTFPKNSRTKRIDNELIRKYDGYWRVDTVGLKAGTYYIKVDAVKIDVTTKEPTDVIASGVTGPLTVTNYDRSGFAFSKSSKHKSASGAYNDDGTLKNGAQVIYVTSETAKTVELDVIVDSKGKTEHCVGLQTILDKRQKCYDSRPLDIRIIGCVTANDLDHMSSTAEGLQIKGKSSDNNMQITLEGIGEDAVVKEFGFLIRNCGNIELRNFAIMAFMDDGVSVDTDNCNIWIHDLDIFYGSTGGDSDQAKGDGSVDVKSGSTYVTVSYNHFWDSGKCSLCGMEKVGDAEFMVTYHHNWFDHSDSRHPRVRRGSVHIYNNYFDGNAKYGPGAANMSSLFVEANYFRACNYPMIISGNASDVLGGNIMSGEVGGMIKAYNNTIEGAKNLVYANSNGGGATSAANETNFDAYLAKTRDEKVPDTYTTINGGNKYNNFDTGYDLGVTPDKIDSPNDVKAIVTAKAGRLNGGDFARAGYAAFTGSSADTYYAVDATLKSAVVGYTPSVKSIGGINGMAVTPPVSSSGAGLTPSGVTVPVPNVPAGKVESGTSITLTATPGNAVIYYTLDGSNPAKADNASRKKYPDEPITITGSVIIKAIAVLEGDGEIADASAVAQYMYSLSSGSYTITINKDDGSDPDTLTVQAGDLIPSEYLKAPVKEGHTFINWVDENGAVVPQPCMPSRNMTITAKWKVNTVEYTITVDLNYEGAVQQDPIKVTAGESITGLTTPTRDGYIFKGWVDEEGTAVTASYVPGKDMTIKATWEVIPTGDENHYVILIDKNDGSSPIETLSIEKNKEITSEELPDPSRTGYTFKGWEDKDGNKITLPYTPEKDMTIKATWEKKDDEGNKEPTDVPNGLWFTIINADRVDKLSDGTSVYVYSYTGKAIKPEVSVYDHKTLLREKADYSIAYKNNIKANNASDEKSAPTITVTGKGNYADKETMTFVIEPQNIAGDAFAAEDIAVVVKNNAQKPVPALTWDGKKLKKNSDFTYAYYANKTDTATLDSVKDEKAYFIKLSGSGNFTGERWIDLNVVGSNVTLMSGVTVKIGNVAYDEEAKKAAGDNFKGFEPDAGSIVVKKGRNNLVVGEDYTITYTNNKETGTAYAVVKGIVKQDGTGYCGTKIVSYKITGLSIKKAKVELKPATGESASVYDGKGWDAWKDRVEVSLDATPLVRGSDYKLAISGNQVNAGKLAVTVTGIGKYEGVIKKSVQIAPYDLSSAEIGEGKALSLEYAASVSYVKGGAKPAITLKFNGTTLTEGTDYTVTYKNNKAAAASDAAKAPEITIKGKGNFKGALQPQKFSIVKKVLSDGSITDRTPDVALNNGGKYIVAPVLVDVDGNVLKAGTDYEKQVAYKIVQGGVESELAAKNVTAAAGDVVKFTVTAKGNNYEGTFEGSYKIADTATAWNVSKAKITIKPQRYTGTAIKLNKADITVMVGTTKLTAEQYDILEGSYVNNVKKGTAKVTIVGKSGYGGAKTVSFKIQSQQLQWWQKLINK